MGINTGSRAAVVVAPVRGEQEGRQQWEDGRGRGRGFVASDGSGAIQTGEAEGGARADLCEAVASGIAQRGARNAHGKACGGDKAGWVVLVGVVVGVGMERGGGGSGVVWMGMQVVLAQAEIGREVADARGREVVGDEGGVGRNIGVQGVRLVAVRHKGRRGRVVVVCGIGGGGGGRRGQTSEQTVQVVQQVRGGSVRRRCGRGRAGVVVEARRVCGGGRGGRRGAVRAGGADHIFGGRADV